MQLILCKDTHNSKQEEIKQRVFTVFFYLFFHLFSSVDNVRQTFSHPIPTMRNDSLTKRITGGIAKKIYNIWRLNENVVTLHPDWNNYTISII